MTFNTAKPGVQNTCDIIRRERTPRFQAIGRDISWNILKISFYPSTARTNLHEPDHTNCPGNGAPVHPGRRGRH